MSVLLILSDLCSEDGFFSVLVAVLPHPHPYPSTDAKHPFGFDPLSLTVLLPASTPAPARFLPKEISFIAWP